MPEKRSFEGENASFKSIKFPRDLQDTTDFLKLKEKTKIVKEMLVAMDVTSLYTNIPQKEGINIVCNAYETFHLNKPPIPTLYLRDMLGLILKENSFHLNKKNYLQTHGTAMETKLAVSLTNIFTAAVKRKIINGATSSRTLGKDISMMSFLYGTKTKRK